MHCNLLTENLPTLLLILLNGMLMLCTYMVCVELLSNLSVSDCCVEYSDVYM